MEHQNLAFIVRTVLSMALVWSTMGPLVVAQRAGSSKAAEGVFSVTLTYTEQGNVKVKPKKPKDVDDTEFSVRINAAFERRVRISSPEGSGLSIESCVEFNPEGGCKTYFPLSYSGSAVFRTTHKLHAENGAANW